MGAQQFPPDISALQRLEAEIANLMTEEKGALHDLRSAIIAKATAAVEIGRRLRIIKDEALYKLEGLPNWTAYLISRDEQNFFTRTSAMRWVNAAAVCENVPELAAEPTKAAEIAGLDPELQKLLGPLIAGPDYGKEDVRTVTAVIKHLPPEDQQTLVTSVLRDNETLANLIENRTTGYALELAAAEFRREKIVKPVQEKNWQEDHEREEEQVVIKLQNAITRFTLDVIDYAKVLDAHGGLDLDASELLAGSLHHVETALATLRRLARVADEPRHDS